jgi:hypothetical protein
MNKYKEWIEMNYPTSTESYGNCKKAVEQMKSEFPELTITNGFVFDAMWGERAHWWLKTEDNSIIDPTFNQFPALVDYNEIDDNHPARNYPEARCHECGERYYETPELKGVMHTKVCQNRYMSYLNSGNF